MVLKSDLCKNLTKLIGFEVEMRLNAPVTAK
ncbi:hypothetical protein Mucpa_3921 [Mucilaginibacter paludis DSM 18603]|uniref:Uncharacterized protein n=1 Tax=Mucilaginibacter paludis DSM 18603 TaxID=714943 RepID=H1Y2G4_9SPHI|nr:hypothetical protein Mucpa_3921 [Mucilaginibacter paludis DSM 18603]